MPDLADRLARADDRTLSAALESALWGRLSGRDFGSDPVCPECGAEVIPTAAGRAWCTSCREWWESPARDLVTPSGALAVIEAMSERGYQWNGSSKLDGFTSVFMPGGSWINRTDLRARAETFPRAVALAALLYLHASGALPAAALALTTETA
jgi:hypothetical protein